MTNNLRLAKFIAMYSSYSKREAEALIFAGKVSVNGSCINTPVYFVTKNDEIKVKNKIISAVIKNDLWLYYKPTGCLCSFSDPFNRKTIYDDLHKYNLNQKPIYIGRLDYNSEGLLLLTTNNALANSILNANYIRTYKVKTFGFITNKRLLQLQNGITIKGINYKPIKAHIITQKNKQSWIEFNLSEGKKNEIRVICEYFKLKVSKLIRVSFGPYKLSNLQSGELKKIDV